ARKDSRPPRFFGSERFIHNDHWLCCRPGPADEILGGLEAGPGQILKRLNLPDSFPHHGGWPPSDAQQQVPAVTERANPERSGQAASARRTSSLPSAELMRADSTNLPPNARRRSVVRLELDGLA